MQPSRRQFYVDPNTKLYNRIIVWLAALLLLAIVAIIILVTFLTNRDAAIGDEANAAAGQNYFSLNDGSGFIEVPGTNGGVPDGYTPGPTPTNPNSPSSPGSSTDPNSPNSPGDPGTTNPTNPTNPGSPSNPSTPGGTTTCTIFTFSPELCTEVAGHIMVADADLPIFAQSATDVTPRIAPGDSGSYNFTVLNNSPYVMAYRLFFQEDNPQHINMLFRLRSGDTYLAGSDNSWVTVSSLGALVDYMPQSGATPYTLDWKWESSPTDTTAGISADRYIIRIISYSEERT